MWSNLFRGSYFRVLVVGHENRENLDLVKISRYTVPKRSQKQFVAIYIDLYMFYMHHKCLHIHEGFR